MKKTAAVNDIKEMQKINKMGHRYSYPPHLEIFAAVEFVAAAAAVAARAELEEDAL